MTGWALFKRLRRASGSAGLPVANTAGIEAVARTHVGLVRQINEDRFLVRSDRGLWAVADGMGGHTGGSRAAEIAIEELGVLADGTTPLCADAICSALARANERIREGLREQQATSGTTIVVAVVRGQRLSVFWAGDSRAYLVRRGSVRCLTRDHSVVQELIDAGGLDKAKADRHPYSHLVTRALGASVIVRPDQVDVDWEPGDRLLLCSDGISRTLDQAAVANGAAVLGQFADDMLGTALRADGSDNATLVAIQLDVAPSH